MFQIVILIVAFLTFVMAIKALTPSGIDLGIGGKKLTGGAGVIAGICLLGLSLLLAAFALVGMSLLFA